MRHGSINSDLSHHGNAHHRTKTYNVHMYVCLSVSCVANVVAIISTDRHCLGKRDTASTERRICMQMNHNEKRWLWEAWLVHWNDCNCKARLSSTVGDSEAWNTLR